MTFHLLITYYLPIELLTNLPIELLTNLPIELFTYCPIDHFHLSLQLLINNLLNDYRENTARVLTPCVVTSIHDNKICAHVRYINVKWDILRNQDVTAKSKMQ